MSLESSILAELSSLFAANHTIRRWVVAYSGGLDSTVLLHLVATLNQQLSKPLAIVALHINHQLSAHAFQWEQHCQQAAANLSVDFHCERVDVERRGQGVEAAAREARYRVFEAFLGEDDVLLMGHHADDQSETVLLRLLRGSGVLGLSGIPKNRPVGRAQLYRPLLSHARDELCDYASQHFLQWIEDESNASDEFDRNYLRHHVLPLLEHRWPQAKKQLQKSARYFQQSHNLLTELAEEDLQAVNQRSERYGVSIDWKKTAQLSPERIDNLIRYWCTQQQYSLPDSQQLQQIHEQFFSRSALLTSAVVNWSNIELRQFNQRLFLMPSLPDFVLPQDTYVFDGESLYLGAAGRLWVEENDCEGGLRIPKKLLDQGLLIRWRSGGERCTPVNRSASQTVKKLLQEYGLETWLRDRVPLLYSGGELVAVGDLWLCKPYAEPDLGDTRKLYWSL